MLNKIPKILSPELIKAMMEMGHGDTLVLADGNFPAKTCGTQVIRMDGHGVPEILDAVLQLFPLDIKYTEYPAELMQVVPGDTTVPKIWDTYKNILSSYKVENNIAYIERFAFYEKAKHASVIVASGEEAIYANIILTKGIVQ